MHVFAKQATGTQSLSLVIAESLVQVANFMIQLLFPAPFAIPSDQSVLEEPAFHVQLMPIPTDTQQLQPVVNAFQTSSGVQAVTVAHAQLELVIPRQAYGSVQLASHAHQLVLAQERQRPLLLVAAIKTSDGLQLQMEEAASVLQALVW